MMHRLSLIFCLFSNVEYQGYNIGNKSIHCENENMSSEISGEWTSEVVISDGYTSYPNQNNIACGVGGKVHAVWYKWDRGARYSVWYNCYTVVQWGDVQRLSITNIFACHPSITSWLNNVYCVWESNWGYSEILLRRLMGEYLEDTVIVISKGTKHTYAPSLACDMQGAIHIVWEKDYEIYYRKFYGSVLFDEIVLSNSNVYTAYPEIVTFSDRLFVTWTDLRDGNFEIYFKEFANNQWSADKRVTNSYTTSIFPTLCVDSIGVVHIVWQEDTPGGYKIYYTKYEQNNFSPCTLIVNSPCEAITPSIVAQGSRVHLVWSDSRDGDSEIYYKVKNQTGWTDDTRVTYSPGISANPSLSVGSDGSLYLLFWDTRVPSAKVYFKKKSSSKQEKVTPSKLTVSPTLFCDRTVIRFHTSKAKDQGVRVQIYDVAGRTVNSWDLEFNILGTYEVMWDGTDNLGTRVKSGVYFVTIQVDREYLTHYGRTEKNHFAEKIILIR